MFVFHSIQPDLFEENLIYLKDNGYATITADEYYQCIENKKTIPKNLSSKFLDSSLELKFEEKCEQKDIQVT